MQRSKINLRDMAYEQVKFRVYSSCFDNGLFSIDNLKLLSKIKMKDLLSIMYWIYLSSDYFNKVYKMKTGEGALVEEYYKKLLNGMKKLSEELDLENSLELSNLYSYLLYHGYLSKTKKNSFNSKDRKFIVGLYYADIMDGYGVCVNHANMLSDFLNVCGYGAAALDNYMGGDIESDYASEIIPDIDVEEGDGIWESISDKIADILDISTIISGNHVFTLIYDNGLYIYDTTNMNIYRIIDPYTAEIINGSGIVSLKPYLSYPSCYTQTEKDVISKLFDSSNYSTSYNRDKFIITTEKNIELFRSSISLLDDFYDDVSPIILGISEETDRINTRKRKLKR